MKSSKTLIDYFFNQVHMSNLRDWFKLGANGEMEAAVAGDPARRLDRVAAQALPCLPARFPSGLRLLLSPFRLFAPYLSQLVPRYT